MDYFIFLAVNLLTYTGPHLPKYFKKDDFNNVMIII